MQDRLIALRIVVNPGTGQVPRGRPGPGNGHLFPRPIPHPRTLLLPGVANVEQAYGLAVLLKFVLHLACQREGLRPGHVDAAILQLAAIEHGNGDKPAAVWLARLAGPLQYGDGAQLGSVFGGFCHLAGILRACGENGKQADERQNRFPRQ